jgi:small subunit ribosomal protein S16
MVRIRLRRTGKKKQPSYRVVVADSEFPRDGRFIENIGFYNPRTEPITFEIREDRALYWLSQGAQPSDAVARLLRKQGILAKFEAMKSGQPLEVVAAESEDVTVAADEPEPAAEDVTAAADEPEPAAEVSEEVPAEEVAAEEATVEETPESETVAESE